MQATAPELRALLGPLTSTPSLDKLSAFAADWKAAEAEEQREEYLAALRTLDWQMEFCDDGARRRRARAKLLRIRELQPIVDPDCALFNAARPGRHGDVTLGAA